MRYTPDILVNELVQQGISDRCFFITGGNSGFGYLVSSIYLSAGAEVVIGCRSRERAEEACNKLKSETGSTRISYLLIDMCNPQSIRDCVNTIESKQIPINVLINNAGVSLIAQYSEAMTGVEKTFQTNYLGVVYLTDLITPFLERQKSPRVIFVSSLVYPKGTIKDITPAHLSLDEAHYHRFLSYCQSKYLITSYCQFYSFSHPSISAFACDPGVAATNIGRELGCIGKAFSLSFFQLFVPTAKGACTIAFAGASDEVKEMCQSGEMVRKCKKKDLILGVKNRDEQRQIYEATKQLIGDINQRLNVQ